MEAVEFIRTIQKMCAGTDCDDCPLNAKNGCNVCYAEDPVESVRIVEEWAAEQERQKAEQERQKAEQERQKPEQGVVGCLDPETSMEVLGFMKQRKRMCDYYGDDTCVCDDSRGECPALDMDCSFTTDHPEHLIAITEQWAKEHPEEQEQERQKPEQESQKAEQEKRLREMEGQIGILRGKTQMLAEAIAMQTNKINALQEMMKKARREIRLVDALSLRFMETECDEMAKMEKRLTERIEKLEKGGN